MKKRTRHADIRPGINARATQQRRVNPASSRLQGAPFRSPGIHARAGLGVPLLLIGFLLTGCATGGPVETGPVEKGPAKRRVISTPNAPAAIAAYSQGIQVGGTLYVAGQIGLDPATRELVPGGIKEETRRALENCKAILEAAGFSLQDVAQVQVLLADIDDYQAMNEVYVTYFPEAPPARAAYAVAAIPRGARVEIVMTAVREK